MKHYLSIELKKFSYDPFIDALKGFSILFVVFNHALPLYLKRDIVYNLWGGFGVPIFLLLQSFHSYKRGLDCIKPFSVNGFLRKMVAPYLFAELLIVVILGLENGDLIGFARNVLSHGGIGPGDHYIWIFLQFVVLLPICAKIFNKADRVKSAIIMIAISVGLEVFCSYTHISDRPYNFLFFRYFFLIYLGFLWAQEGIVLNGFRLTLSIISILFIFLFDYANLDLSPWFFHTTRRTNHWICYFYGAFLFPFLLRWVYEHMGTILQKALKFCGKRSWWIFCTQIVVFSILSPGTFSFIDSTFVRNVIYLVSAIALSIIPSIAIDQIEKRVQRRQAC